MSKAVAEQRTWFVSGPWLVGVLFQHRQLDGGDLCWLKFSDGSRSLMLESSLVDENKYFHKICIRLLKFWPCWSCDSLVIYSNAALLWTNVKCKKNLKCDICSHILISFPLFSSSSLFIYSLVIRHSMFELVAAHRGSFLFTHLLLSPSLLLPPLLAQTF